MATDAKGRLMAKVERLPSGCWEWAAHRFPTGYGQFWLNGKDVYAHRAAYELFIGPVGGLHVCHHCDNPGCVNPSHLFLGTHADNMGDMKRKGRHRCVCGERIGSARLTSDAVKRIRERLSRGVPQRAVAREFGVGKTTVGRIALGKTWKHLETNNG